MPPLRPMLAKATDRVPEGEYLYEPKWDGFRCIVFRDGDELELQSRNERPLTRYFPELLAPLSALLPPRVVLDGELVVATDTGLDFDLLGQRIHPAESRVEELSARTPATFVAFDLLALDTIDLRPLPFADRRAVLEEVVRPALPSLLLTPSTRDPEVATDWFQRFEGAGFDGVMAKPLDDPYQPDKRAQFKVKHKRTAECVVAGYRLHKEGGVGSLLLGLWDAAGRLHQVGVASSFPASQRRVLAGELLALEADGTEAAEHPWAAWGDPEAHDEGPRMPGAPSRWSATRTADGRGHEWVPLRLERVVEVTYEGMTNGRFRHPARFLRWRPDKDPADCTYAQLDHPAPVEFAALFHRV